MIHKRAVNGKKKKKIADSASVIEQWTRDSLKTMMAKKLGFASNDDIFETGSPIGMKREAF